MKTILDLLAILISSVSLFSLCEHKNVECLTLLGIWEATAHPPLNHR